MRPSQKRSALHSSWKARVPTHWGRKTWDALFLLAADYPHAQECDDDDPLSSYEILKRRRAWKKMLRALPGVIACDVCSYHFQRYLDRNDGRSLERALKNRESLLRWLYRAKDKINKLKYVKSIPFENVKNKYVPRCTNQP